MPGFLSICEKIQPHLCTKNATSFSIVISHALVMVAIKMKFTPHVQKFMENLKAYRTKYLLELGILNLAQLGADMVDFCRPVPICVVSMLCVLCISVVLVRSCTFSFSLSTDL